ncbi:Hypothetical predicted protein [Mytilus galloprovincialis]|uniref:Uncharacterized protein n=1 Tax=Mytilus galloprovincialis TaxID=29158 RepID=A0A8B6DET3_MYTGA|nr:Hypothetical predicted protein [Mytilus galloprovincialis]
MGTASSVNSCKDNVHLRIAKDHRIINITDIGELDSGESFNFSDSHCNEHSNQFLDEEEFLSKKRKLWERHKNAVKKIDDLSPEESKLRKIKESEDALFHKAKENIQKRLTTDADQWSQKLVELNEKRRSVYREIEREIRNIDKRKRKVSGVD